VAASTTLETLDKFSTFGDLLRFLRRRAGLTQMELAIAVGYSDAQVSRLEQNLRQPDIPTVEARFPEALGIEDQPRVIARLLELAATVRREDGPSPGACPYKGLDYFDEADAEVFAAAKPGARSWRNACSRWTWASRRVESVSWQ
jgi:transcriptional regulator with XRE-family HTH domain